jgi:tripartite-type tricarboxylate transporter receptor subunit TctC
MMNKYAPTWVYASIAALCAAIPGAALAESAANFYKDKTITFYVGYNPGGGYDLYSRTFATHLGRNIPGNPTVVVQNMPGGGGVRATNYMYNLAPKDGTVLGMVDQGIGLKQVLDPKSIKGDVRKLTWIGRISPNESVLFAWHTAPVKKIQDAYTKELVIAAAGENSRMLSKVMKNMLGMKLKIITGYKGSGDARLALERGEVHATTQPWTAIQANQPEWIKDKKINILMLAGLNSPADLKTVPKVADLGRNDEERKILELMAGGSDVGRSVTSPPGQSAERVADLRGAFMKTMKDPEFVAGMKKIGLALDPQSGEELQKLVVKSVDDVPEALAAKARKLAEFQPRKPK